MPPSAGSALVDTSVFIAAETGRQLGALPPIAAVSVVTIAELYLGVLSAKSAEIRTHRLSTLSAVQRTYRPLPIDVAVAQVFAEIMLEERRSARRFRIMDAWIAATAIAHDLTLYTQDADFSPIPRLRVVRV